MNRNACSFGRKKWARSLQALFAWLLSHEPAVYDISDPESGKLPVILRQRLRNYKRRSNTTYYWAYEQYGIWGLTARFLVRFRDMLLAGEYQPTWKR